MQRDEQFKLKNAKDIVTIRKDTIEELMGTRFFTGNSMYLLYQHFTEAEQLDYAKSKKSLKTFMMGIPGISKKRKNNVRGFEVNRPVILAYLKEHNLIEGGFE